MLDLSKVKFVDSPNFYIGRKGPITHIVIHAMQGFYTSTISMFQKPVSKVSAHYLISKAGDITQMVKTNDRAWHVGNANGFTIGIEHEDGSIIDKKFLNCINDPNWITTSELSASVDLCAALCKKFNIPVENIIGHNSELMRKYMNNHADPGPYFNMIGFRKQVKTALENG